MTRLPSRSQIPPLYNNIEQSWAGPQKGLELGGDRERRSSKTYSCSTARRRYTPVYTHSGGASVRPKEEALSGSVPQAGSLLSKPEGGALDCGVASFSGEGPLTVLESIGLFPGVRSSGEPAIDRLACGACWTLGPRPGKQAIDKLYALQVL